MGGTDRALSVSPPKAAGRISMPAETAPAFELTSESSIDAATTPSSLRECSLVPYPPGLARPRSPLPFRDILSTIAPSVAADVA
jgi:hypothetical protein